VKHLQPATAMFTGAAGNTLVADVYGDAGDPVMLLHGGGQTRHAWRHTAEHLARSGAVAYAFDQRGHGDSEWIADGSYAFTDFAADAAAVATTLSARCGKHPIAIGASLGGISSLLADGTAERAGRGPILAAIVLVDITPRVDQSGVAKVQGFMRERAIEGFATIAEAADAVAAYLPHRKRPRSLDGLKKNLRLHPDGRWRWHWDPRMVAGARSFAIDPHILEAALTEAARALTIPALLVRGGSSEIVHEAHVRDFLELVPHAEAIDVSGARHMVAGDSNDSFADAVLEFVGKLEGKERVM
jgi:pimeloyl-ACP methyl ester carboxylesterase